jgi:hypothetical protein
MSLSPALSPRPIHIITNVQTGEVIERPYTDEEMAVHEANQYATPETPEA